MPGPRVGTRMVFLLLFFVFCFSDVFGLRDNPAQKKYNHQYNCNLVSSLIIIIITIHFPFSTFKPFKYKPKK